MKPPKYLIQKYYPPAPNTNYIPVPQPILFKSPESPMIPNQKEKPTVKVTLPKDESLITKTSYESIPSRQKRRHKHKHKHRHRHKHKQRSETPSEESDKEPDEEDEKPNKEEEEPEKDDDEDDDEKEKEKEKEPKKKDKEEDESSDPDVRLKLYDPDNPEDDKIIYPSRSPN